MFLKILMSEHLDILNYSCRILFSLFADIALTHTEDDITHQM